MKTAMKKLFSLMLVAVLLVGVMPFQAFADGAPYYQVISPSEGNKTLATVGNLEIGTYDFADFEIPSGYTFDYATKNGNPIEFPVELNDGDVLMLLVNPAPSHVHSAGAEATCTTAQTCTDCGETLVAALGHDVVNYECTRCDYSEAPATIMVQINNSTHAGSFTVAAGKNADAVYAEFKTTAMAAQYKNAYGPVVTLADMVTAMSTTETGETYYLWLSWDEPADEPVVTPDPAVCSVCGAEAINGMCTGCYLDTVDCACKDTAKPEDNRGKVNLTLNYNYKGAKSTKMKVDRNAKIIDIIAGIPAPNRDGHLFSHWTMDAAGEDLIDDERVTAEGVVIYAQWDDDLAIGGKITIKVNLNYDRKMAEPVTNIAKGTRMGDILDYVSIPSRWNHKFVGWYWDRDCTDAVEAGDKVYRNDEIFAKWEKRKTNNEIMLKIYLNGDTKSVAKIADMYDYAKDGEISMNEVKEVVKKYYTAKNSDGMSFIGLFDAKDWSDFVRNHKHHRGSNHIDVNRHDDTTIYVMVTNAKTATPTSSGTPDSTNPKTGDMIFMPAIVLGLSASALAVMFYLNKKRAY